MDRTELLRELDRIIDVGIVNAKHDSDVLKCIRKVLTSPVYVLTSGSYSDYSIQGVTMDRKIADKFVEFLYDPNEVEVYFPLELKVNNDHQSEKNDSFDVEWDPETNEIHKIEYYNDFYSKNMHMVGQYFRFWLHSSKRVIDDVLANGKDSELIKKIAQDKYAEWKYENEIIYVGGMATTQKAFDECYGKGDEDGRSKAEP